MRVETSSFLWSDDAEHVFLDFSDFLIFVETQFLEHLLLKLAVNASTDAYDHIVKLMATDEEVTIVSAHPHGIASRFEPCVVGIGIRAFEMGKELVAANLEYTKHRDAVVLERMSTYR